MPNLPKPRLRRQGRRGELIDARAEQADQAPRIEQIQAEGLRWVNIDTLTHALVADTPGATDFLRTDVLPPSGEQSFIMTKTGRTTFHCTIHPEMIGPLIVRER